MNEDVIKSFLVSIGYQTDETSLRKFQLSLESVTKKVLSLGAVIAATATAVVSGVKIISGEMERLYYASQRTGETVGNIMALRYAAGQIGLTADQAQSSLEGFTRTLRLNPGMNGLLSQLGVTGKGPLQQFDSFIQKTKQMQPYIAAAYAQLFGIDPDTLLMLQQGQDERLAAEEAYRRKLASFGIDPEQAAKVGRDFDNAIRRVKDTFNDLWIVIQSRLAPVLTPLIDQFDRWAQTHAGEIAQAISDAVQRLANWIQSVNWEKVGNDIGGVVDALGGVKGVLIGLTAIALAPLIANVLALATAVVRLGGAASTAGLATLARVLGPLALLFHSKDLNDGEDADLQRRRAQGAGIDPNSIDWNGPINRGGSGANGGFIPDGSIVEESLPSTRTPRGIRNNNPGNIEYGRFTRSMGATGSDGRFAVFESMEDGIRAAIALLQSYAARGIDTVQSIISKWAPSSENNTKAYVDAVAKQIGVSPDAHLNVDQLSQVANAIFRHENGASYGKLGVNPAASNSKSLTVSQKTDVHVHGSTDPAGTGRAVAAEQSRVNADLVRNLTGAYV